MKFAVKKHCIMDKTIRKRRETKQKGDEKVFCVGDYE